MTVPMGRGGGGKVGFTVAVRDAGNPGLARKHGLTFCGVQAAMVVSGDWMARLLPGGFRRMGGAAVTVS